MMPKRLFSQEEPPVGGRYERVGGRTRRVGREGVGREAFLSRL